MKIQIFFLAWFACQCLSLNPTPQGFPANWEGDKYKQAECQIIQQPPDWVDGFLFAQSSASYGDQANPKGQKVFHMFDAISGVSVFDLSGKKGATNTFTGAYYPTKAYKIWEFYDRNMAKSKVAWATTFSDVNATAMKMWGPIPFDDDISTPNVDFWKVGTSIIAGTETLNLGLTFDLPAVTNFRAFPFHDTDGQLKDNPYRSLHMPIHEHVDSDTGMIWNAVLALNVKNNPPTFHQVVYTLDPKGIRTVQGVFDFSPVDMKKCSKDGKYSGPVSGNGIIFPRYMHTVSATVNYLILPMSSLVFRTCQALLQLPYIPDGATIFNPGKNFWFDWTQSAPVTFLLFDKKAKKFLKPIDGSAPLFFTHQLNSYEFEKNKIYTDIIGFDYAAFKPALSIEYVTKTGDHPEWTNHVYRYTIDLDAKTATNKSLLPDNPTKTDFSQINHRVEGKKYKYGYAVMNPLLHPNKIIKIDVDKPDGTNNKFFQPNSKYVSLSEPYFSPRPGSKDEDDGIIVARGLDVSINKTRIYIVNAKDMKQIGEIVSPYYTPFGFHERYYTKQDLGMTSG